jgi:hypothetical protein
MKTFQNLFPAMLIFSAEISIGHTAFASTSLETNADILIPPPALQPETGRELYNAGTEKLRAGKWNDAETLLEASLAKQNERVQPAALFNLGHVCFAQGQEELKKSPNGAAATKRARAATEAGTGAAQMAADALASNDLQQMVQAYFAGRGVRKEMRAATQAVQRAMEAHGKALLKWRRALSDFQSAAELNPADTNAVRNAEIVAQAIARLVDSLREMQAAAAGIGGKQADLNGLLAQLKGRIPAPNAPPGAAGEEDDDEGGKGDRPMPESLSGLQERDDTGGGQELKISPEKAGELLNGLQPDGKPLPIGQGEAGPPRNNSKRIW